MKKPFLKSTLTAIAATAVLAGCGPAQSTLSSIQLAPLTNNVSTLPTKVAKLSNTQLKSWPTMGMISDTVPGMSVKKAYQDIIKDNKGQTVVVAVLDAGVDIDHEDLKDIIWTNKDEIPNNGIDDDKNGYVDDIHGWNFLGDQVHARLNFTRIISKLQAKYEGKTANQVSDADQAEFKLYQRAKKQYDKEVADAKKSQKRFASYEKQFKKTKERIENAINVLKSTSGSNNLTTTDVSNISSDKEEVTEAKKLLSAIFRRSGAKNSDAILADLEKAEKQLQSGEKYFSSKLEYHLNINYDGRKLVGDNPDDITDTGYGNGDVDGPTKDEEDVMHGTHVAGIIAAERNNGIGLNGVANNVKIMAIRAVPDGDEFDKDIALGIHYAVDNGAKIINMSFGKSFSSHSDWVYKALQYAAKHNVLIVHAAGNDGLNLDLDSSYNYPNDQKRGASSEFVNNVLTVGALNDIYGENLVASFSNYGKVNVDVFAPGVEIWSTTPLNHYKFLQGTSMASPEVAGVAAVVWSYFPNLTASQVKHVIMESGITTSINVALGGSASDEKPFNEVSKSGRMVNLYNALIMASKL